MLFDKIGRKFYYPDETGGELQARETIYTGEKHYLNTRVEPPMFIAFPEFDDLILTPYVGMKGPSKKDNTPAMA